MLKQDKKFVGLILQSAFLLEPSVSVRNSKFLHLSWKNHIHLHFFSFLHQNNKICCQIHLAGKQFTEAAEAASRLSEDHACYHNYAHYTSLEIRVVLND